MRALIDRVVFQAGEKDYRWREVLLAAALWGDWREVIRQARLGIAALHRAEAAEEPPIGDEDVEAAANEFRYDRNLVTAEEMEAWLASWKLDVDSWLTWVTTDLLRRSVSPEPPEPDLAAHNEELEAAIWAEAVFSNALLRVAHRLTEKVAIASRLEEEREATGGPAAGPSGEQSVGESPELLQALDLLPLDVPDEERLRVLSALARMDREFESFRASVLDEASLSARIKIHQTDWTRVSVRTLRFASEDAAREAFISIRDDGCDLQEVASDAGVALVDGIHFLETFEPAIRDHILSAPTGVLVGPLRHAEEWLLFVVESKHLASLEDPEIRRRAEDDLFRSVVGREVDNRVSWRWGQ